MDVKDQNTNTTMMWPKTIMPCLAYTVGAQHWQILSVWPKTNIILYYNIFGHRDKDHNDEYKVMDAKDHINKDHKAITKFAFPTIQNYGILGYIKPTIWMVGTYIHLASDGRSILRWAIQDSRVTCYCQGHLKSCAVLKGSASLIREKQGTDHQVAMLTLIRKSGPLN